ncbi:hypothetical protein ACO2Q3_05900 [Caulobacter sp. KR2-114]|uniref:hypothetical protein n=1 Tax=Caulobacter sp. KR2-114 TaxID=3400912 RepID=UPI003BFA8B29
MLFLLNDVIVEFEAARLTQPAIAGHLARLSFGQVTQLVGEAFAENPRLPGGNVFEAQKLALMITLKQPQVNAALVLTPGRVCAPQEVSIQFAGLGAELLMQLKGMQQQGRLNAAMANNLVWSALGQRLAS